jgi:predicted GNAT family acetyltransferase
MEVTRCPDAAEFLTATLVYRGREPVRTNVLASVATLAARGVTTYPESYWWVIHEGNEVVGAAMRTAPYVLSLGPMAPRSAHALAASIAEVDAGLPGVAGFLDGVAAFLEALGDAGGEVVVTESKHQLLYEIEHVVHHDAVGESVAASAEDLALVETWFDAFALEVEGSVRGATTEQHRILAENIREARIDLWRVGGRAVSMAGNAVPIETPSGVVTRVGPVYTPREHRGRGYGSAVTATMSERLLASGSRVMLYADPANPTSNKIYQAMGYELVVEFVRHTFGSRG